MNALKKSLNSDFFIIIGNPETNGEKKKLVSTKPEQMKIKSHSTKVLIYEKHT